MEFALLDSTHTILFDDQCNACNWLVRFVLRRDRAGMFQFVPLKTEAAERALRSAGIDPAQVGLPVCPGGFPVREDLNAVSSFEHSVDSIFLIEKDRVLLRSEAAIGIARAMPFPWSLLSVLSLVPRSIRDGVYRLFARNRHRWFGGCVGVGSTLKRL